MTASGDHETNPSLLSAARLALAHWRHVLRDGLTAVGHLPGLLAEVDQHAAHVRDSLLDHAGRLSLLHLAAYADGVVDTATNRGWDLAEAHRGDWESASWPLVRLIAVCSLASTAT